MTSKSLLCFDGSCRCVISLLRRPRRAQLVRFQNADICALTQQVIFTAPYYLAPANRHTAPQLDGLARTYRYDVDARAAATALKVTCFCMAQTPCPFHLAHRVYCNRWHQPLLVCIAWPCTGSACPSGVHGGSGMQTHACMPGPVVPRPAGRAISGTGADSGMHACASRPSSWSGSRRCCTATCTRAA